MSISKQFLTVRTDSLIPYENNPRINEPAVADVMESIRQCENLDPIEVDEGFVILSGHTRLIAMQRLGITETEIIQYTGLTDEQKRKYRILANKTNELADWDFGKLEAEIADLDFSDFSFDLAGNADAVDGTDDTEAIDRTGNLAKEFLIPPFSVLYGNKGEWLKRKKTWLQMGIKSEIGRGGDLCFSSPDGWRDSHR